MVTAGSITMEPGPAKLLATDEAPACTVLRPGATSNWVLVCDHASAAIPRRLQRLGLGASELSRHIAWDIGIAGLARDLSARLDASCFLQNYSRLVIDCNRPLHAPDSIATLSDGTAIPGNADDIAGLFEARRREIFEPYHAAIASELDARRADGRPTLLAALHSFTPRFQGFDRPWQLGVLYASDDRLARVMLGILRESGEWAVGDNEPYSASAETDYAIPVHGEARGIACVEIEVRQDLIADNEGQRRWSELLCLALLKAQNLLRR